MWCTQGGKQNTHFLSVVQREGEIITLWVMMLFLPRTTVCLSVLTVTLSDTQSQFHFILSAHACINSCDKLPAFLSSCVPEHFVPPSLIQVSHHLRVCHSLFITATPVNRVHSNKLQNTSLCLEQTRVRQGLGHMCREQSHL